MFNMQFRHFNLALCFVLGSSALYAANNKEQDRLEQSGIVMQEILDVPENIPQELLEKAECVIVIPSMTKIALGIGGSYGRGAMVCRSGTAFKDHGAHQPCTHLRVAASGCSSAPNQRCRPPGDE